MSVAGKFPNYGDAIKVMVTAQPVMPVCLSGGCAHSVVSLPVCLSMTQKPSVANVTSTNRVHDVAKPVQTTPSARSLPTALSVMPVLPILESRNPVRRVGRRPNVLPE